MISKQSIKVLSKLVFGTPVVLLPLVTVSLHAQSKMPDLTQASAFAVVNRGITLRPEGNTSIVHLDARPKDGIAWINGLEFTTGNIEFDVKGRDIMQASFVGIAFHGANDSTFDVIYFRPFNFESSDPARKSHSVQYISLPKYDWSYLREHDPGKYENDLPTTVSPNDWFHVKVEVNKDLVRVFVDRNTKSCLEVKPISDHSEGKVGFWVGNNSDGEFSNLKMSTP